MKELKNVFALAKRTVTAPSAAAEGLAAPGAGLGGPLAIYAVYCAAYSLFLYHKPAGFPAELAETSLEFADAPYARLLSLQAISELLFAGIFCALFPAFAGAMKEGRLAAKFALGLAACAVYAGAAFFSRETPLAGLPFLAAAAAAAVMGVRARASGAAAFFRFSLASNAVILICLPVFFTAAALRNETLYLGGEAAAGLWLTALVLKAARTLFDATITRSALALLFSFAFSVLSLYLLRNLGVMPPWLFRFMLFS